MRQQPTCHPLTRLHAAGVRPRTQLLVLLASGLLLSGSVHAQSARYELGRRVRTMEEAWEANRDPRIRSAALPPIKRAVENFFALRLPAAARELDEARLVLEGKAGESPDGKPAATAELTATAARTRDLAARRWSAALSFEPTRRLLDPNVDTHLRIDVRLFYAATPPPTNNIRLAFNLRTVDGQKLTTVEIAAASDKLVPTTVHAAKDEWRGEARLPLNAAMANQDCRLEGIAIVDGTSYNLGSTGVSLAAGLAERLAALRMPLNDIRSENVLTLKEHLRVLEALAGGRTLETDYPAYRLLEETSVSHQQLRQTSVTPGDSEKSPDQSKLADGKRLSVGQHWRVIAGSQGSSCTTRLLIPASAAHGTTQAATSRPLVVAVHGAGGSENMFFDAYGAGKIVRLCESRGWILAAPRQGLFGGIGIRWDELIAGVSRLADVDNARVYLVGHSLGAMQAARLADSAERKPSFVAALGGGGRIGRFEPLRDVPFFVGVGDQDFGRGGGQQLAEQLRRGGIRDVRFREYADTEHLTIVQVALDDIFQQWDERDTALRMR
jgi:pimeloyl-ACP methyl ester carboxylesterase